MISLWPLNYRHDHMETTLNDFIWWYLQHDVSFVVCKAHGIEVVFSVPRIWNFERAICGFGRDVWKLITRACMGSH